MQQFRINGTDAGTIMGANKYSSPYELWLIKTGRQEKPDLSNKESVQWGIRLEESILEHVCAEFNGLQPADKHRQVWVESNDHGFPMTGFVDYYDCNVLIEIKTANSYALAEWQAGVPAKYYWQVMHYLVATGMNQALVACLVGGQTLVMHWVEFDSNAAAELIDAEAAFYQCLINDTEPPMENVPEQTVIDNMDVDVERLCEAYLRINADLAPLEKTKKMIASQIQELLGKNTVQTGSTYKASYKYYPQRKFDDKALAEAEPEVYSKYIKESGYYKLDIKGIKP